MATINFDSNYYIQEKLAQLQANDPEQYGDWTAENVEQAFADSGLTAQQHYTLYGYIEGLNPSADFDSTAYLQAKLAQLQESGQEGFESIADVAEAFRASGLSPLDHYNLYGEDEGIEPVAAGDNGSDNGGSEGPEGPDAPTPTLDVAFDTSEKTGTTVSLNDDGTLSLNQQDQGDNLRFLGKEQYDQNGQYPTSSDFRINLSNQLNYASVAADGVTDVDAYEATFLSPVLTPTGGINAGSILDLRFADRLADANDTDSTLSNTQVNNFQFTFNGQEFTVDNTNTDGLLGAARSYPELLQAIQTGIQNLQASNPDLAGLNVRNGSTFFVDQYDQADQRTGEQVSGTSIVLSAREGELGGFRANVSSADTGGVDSYARAFDQTTESVEGLIQTTLDLDNVGYGSQGGSLNVTGGSNSNVGVEKFIVNAENGVWLTKLGSQNPGNNNGNDTYNHLKVVELNGSGYFRAGAQSSTYGHSNADGSYFTGNGQTASWISPFIKDLNDTSIENVLQDQGLVDVRAFDASGFNGSVALNAFITDNVIDRDLNLVDTNGNPAADNVQYNYTLTGGDDVLNMAVDGAVVAQEDFRLNIDTGAGNDVIHLQLSDLTANQLANQQLNNNISVDAGNGNNRVWTEGAGNANIVTGSGNDVIYTDNSGAQIVNGAALGQNEGRAQFVFNNDTTDIDDLLSNSDAGNSNGANGNAQSFAFNNGGVQVTFRGFTSDVIAINSTGTEDNATTSTLQINQAIKAAINSDPVLSQLLLAKDGAGNALVVDSKIDGDIDLADLGISFQTQQDDGTYGPFTDPSNVVDRYTTEYAQAGGTDITGANSAAESDNTIDAGAGNDVIVLGTGANSNDTLVFTGFNNGVNSIVNFEVGTAGDDATDAQPGTAEVTTVDLSGLTLNIGDTFIFDGQTVTVADDAGNPDAAQFYTDLAGLNSDDYSFAADATGQTFTVTNTQPGNATDLTAADFTGTLGDALTAADVTVVQGTDPVPAGDATDGTIAGRDFLDFTSYWGEGDDQAATTLGALGTDNAVELEAFSDRSYGEGVDFDSLTAANVQQTLGAGNAANTQFDNVLMIQDGTSGDYKAFYVSSNEGSTDYNVQLIGQIDFGQETALTADNFA